MSIIKAINRGLVERSFSAEELAKKYINSIKKQNMEINCFVTVTEEIALGRAKEIDEKTAKEGSLSLLEGVPYSLKDNISTIGTLTTCASKMLESYQPVYNAYVSSVLENAGGILLGKNNMDEFAMGSASETSFFGCVKNPLDTACSPGGSSGGGSAAVCGNMAVFALGSDTGGSVRQPASYCGLVGLKPTYGAVSRYGLVAYASSLDQIGVLAKNAEDTAIVFDSISERDLQDSTCRGFFGNTLERLKESVCGIKIGLYNPSDTEACEALEKTAKVFESLGCKVEEICLNYMNEVSPAYYIIACAEAASNLARYDGVRYGYRTKKYNSRDEMICRTRGEGFGEEVKKRILFGNYVLSGRDNLYKKANAVRKGITAELESLFEGYDVILMPTTYGTAPLLGAKASYSSDRFTVPANLAGLPALSMPCGRNENGMPFGIQLMGKRFSEGLLLRLAYKYEKETKEEVSRIEL